MSVLSVDATIPDWLPVESLTVRDVEAVRLLLRSDSSMDWHRLNFKDREEVDHYLKVNLFDTSSLDDLHRLRVLHNHAVQYLRNHFNLRFPKDLERPTAIQDLFLHASFNERRFNRRKLLSCMILKVMGIVHHIEARALVFRTPMSDADMFNLVQDRVSEMEGLLRQAGAPVKEVYGSQKSRDSLISKLLSKKETFAAAVFDKFRYRVVVNEHEDLLPVLAFLLRSFIPFNYVVPGQTFNNLLDPREQLDAQSDLFNTMDGILSNYRWEESWGYQDRRSNEFSGSTYRMVNFIADIPVRLDAFLTPAEIRKSGRTGFALIELQLVDSETNIRNEFGSNSHKAYKARRKARVLERLRWGGMLKTSIRQDQTKNRHLEEGRAASPKGPDEPASQD